jgi:alpha-tubulin suppressor-like RCC1 family protein
VNYTKTASTFAAVIASAAFFACVKPLEMAPVDLPPPPTGLIVSYDTLRGRAILTWSPVIFTDLAGYIVYRNDTVSSVPEQLSTALVTSTFYIDKIFPDPMDTADLAFTYRLKSRTADGHLSAEYSDPITVGAPSPTKVRTFIAMQCLNTANGAVSINDTVKVTALYHNSTRKNVQVRWLIINRYYGPVVRTANTFALSGTDTVNVVSTYPPNLMIYTEMTDEAHSTWWDSTMVNVVLDVPAAVSGNDTTVPVNGTIRLSGSATQQFGTIREWAWDIGNTGIFYVTSRGDTDIVAPASENFDYQCVLRVTDDDGNTAKDTMRVIVLQNITPLNNLTAGAFYSLVLKSDDTLWACGYNYYGQLGDGTAANRTTPVQVMGDVQNVTSAGFHTLILQKDGSLWACGNNYYGQLGNNTTTNQYKPVLMMTGVQSMAAGYNHSLILKSDGTLWACGHNSFGQLGDSSDSNRTSPVKVMSNVQRIAAGGFHSLILKSDGTLWTCGYNYYGQLGDSTTTNKYLPVQVMTGVESMAAGYHHTLILKSDGSCWACGNNCYGQLGDGSDIDRSTPVQVMNNVQKETASVDGYFSLFMKSDGSLWTCGHNYYGQLGDGTTTNRYLPVQVMTGVQSMAAGYNHTLILKNDGTLWACGYNSYGQLGDGSMDEQRTPVQSVLLQQ